MDFSIKVVMVGAEKVGKSCLLSLLAKEQFEYGYHPTIGADLRVIRKDGVKVCIWDMAGSEKFSSILDGFLKSANVIVFCYSASEPQSFEKALEYYNQYRHMIAKKILVATKCDTATDREYELKGVQAYNQCGMDFVKTSSLRGSGREKLINCILSSYTLHEIPEEPYVEEKTGIKKYCCIC